MSRIEKSGYFGYEKFRTVSGAARRAGRLRSRISQVPSGRARPVTRPAMAASAPWSVQLVGRLAAW